LTPEEAWHRDNKIAAVQNRISYFIYRASETVRQIDRDIHDNKPGANRLLRKALIQGFRRCQFAIAAVEFTEVDVADLCTAMTKYIAWIHEHFLGQPGWARIAEYTKGPAGNGLTIWLQDDPGREAWAEHQTWYDQEQYDFDEYIRSNLAYPCTVTWGWPLSDAEGRYSHQ